jgi:hypothetical protein
LCLVTGDGDLLLLFFDGVVFPSERSDADAGAPQKEGQESEPGHGLSTSLASSVFRGLFLLHAGHLLGSSPAFLLDELERPHPENLQVRCLDPLQDAVHCAEARAGVRRKSERGKEELRELRIPLEDPSGDY